MVVTALARLPREYRFYRGREAEIRSETATVLDRLSIDVEGARLLEIGPAVGYSLDVFRERGALPRFVERHPAFVVACWARGHRGRRLDAIRHRDKLRGYDIVYVRGSITPSNFGGGDDFADWLHSVSAATVVLSPWINGAIPDWFTDTLAGNGYQPTGWIDGYSVPGIYPQAWVRHHPKQGSVG